MDDLLYKDDIFERDPDLDKIYTITLSNGNVIGDLKMNGNNFVSQVEITKDMFRGGLDTVTVSDNMGGEVKYHNMELIQIATYPTMAGWYFILAEIPESQIREEKVRSDVDYIAMMSNIDLF